MPDLRIISGPIVSVHPLMRDTVHLPFIDPGDIKFYSVLNLTDFFSVPVEPTSQWLFALE